MAEKDYYKILGVEKGASKEESVKNNFDCPSFSAQVM
jgi:DnaJ-class molecular chaperone